MESSLARYWPEVTELVELGSAKLLALLARIGGPRDVSGETAAPRKLMLGMSHRLMSEEKVEAVLLCAQMSVGLPMLAQERAMLMTLAGEAHRALKEFRKAKAEVECQPASKSARSWAAWRWWPESRGAESQIRAGGNSRKLGLSAAGFG